MYNEQTVEEILNRASGWAEENGYNLFPLAINYNFIDPRFPILVYLQDPNDYFFNMPGVCDYFTLSMGNRTILAYSLRRIASNILFAEGNMARYLLYPSANEDVDELYWEVRGLLLKNYSIDHFEKFIEDTSWDLQCDPVYFDQWQKARWTGLMITMCNRVIVEGNYDIHTALELQLACGLLTPLKVNYTTSTDDKIMEIFGGTKVKENDIPLEAAHKQILRILRTYIS